MNNKSEVKMQIENIQNEIITKLDKDGIVFSPEILKLSEELDRFINIWYQVLGKKPKT